MTEVEDVKTGSDLSFLIVGLSLALAACSGEVEYGDICEPGAVCICPNDERGTQVCEDDGTSQCACGGDTDAGTDIDAGTGTGDTTEDPSTDPGLDPGQDPREETTEDVLETGDSGHDTGRDIVEEAPTDVIDVPDIGETAPTFYVINAATGIATTLPCAMLTGESEWRPFPEIDFGEATPPVRFPPRAEMTIKFRLDGSLSGDCDDDTGPVFTDTIALESTGRQVIFLAGERNPDGSGALRTVYMDDPMPTPGSASHYEVMVANLFSDAVVSTRTEIWAPGRLGQTEVPAYGLQHDSAYQIDLGRPFRLLEPDLNLSFSAPAVSTSEGCLVVLMGQPEDPPPEFEPMLSVVCETEASDAISLDPRVYILNVIDGLQSSPGRHVSLGIAEPDGSTAALTYGDMTEEPIWVSSSVDDITFSAGARDLTEINVNDLPLEAHEISLVVAGGNNLTIETLAFSRYDLLVDVDHAAVLINARSNLETISFDLSRMEGDTAGSGDRDFLQATTVMTSASGFERLSVNANGDPPAVSDWVFTPDHPDRHFLIVSGNPVAEAGRGALHLFSVDVDDEEAWEIEQIVATSGTIWVRLVNAMFDDGSIRVTLNEGLSEWVPPHAASDWMASYHDGAALSFRPLYDDKSEEITANETDHVVDADVSIGDLITVFAFGSEDGAASATPTLLRHIGADPSPNTVISVAVGVNEPSATVTKLFDADLAAAYGQGSAPLVLLPDDLDELPLPWRVHVDWPLNNDLPNASFTFPEGRFNSEEIVGHEVLLLVFGRTDLPPGQDGWPRMMVLNERDFLDTAEADTEVFFIHAVPDLVAFDNEFPDEMSLELSWDGGTIGTLGPVGFGTFSGESIWVRPNLPNLQGRAKHHTAYAMDPIALSLVPQVGNFVVAAGYARTILPEHALTVLTSADDRRFGDANDYIDVTNAAAEATENTLAWWTDAGSGWYQHAEFIPFGAREYSPYSSSWSQIGFGPSGSDTEPPLSLTLDDHTPPYNIFAIGQLDCNVEADVHPFQVMVVSGDGDYIGETIACD